MFQRAATFLVLALLLATCSPAPDLLDHVLLNGRLDVVTRNSPTTYFLGVSNQPRGPEFDLLKGFADELGVSLNIHTAASVVELTDTVEASAVHVGGAGLTITEQRRERLRFSEPYQQVTQHLVYRLGTGRPRQVSELIDRSVVVLAGSSHAETLRALKVDLPRLTWREDSEVEVADLLNAVAEGEIDYTIADTTDFNINRNFLPDLRIAFDLEVADSVAWAFPATASERLIEAADRYLVGIRRDGTLARILDRYYGHTEDFDYVGTRAFIRHVDSRLPIYESWFRQAGEVQRLDWRILAAIGYQESHWLKGAVSPTGVRGIMMLTEATADYLDIPDREDPRDSIFGAARFFARLKERLPDDVREPDRTWMALAAYNVGFYHVKDAMQIVRLQGGNPNTWVDVRQALPLLAQKKWYKKVDYGYARGWEPVQYVENIRAYLDILRWLTHAEREPDVQTEPPEPRGPTPQPVVSR